MNDLNDSKLTSNDQRGHSNSVINSSELLEVPCSTKNGAGELLKRPGNLSNNTCPVKSYWSMRIQFYNNFGPSVYAYSLVASRIYPRAIFEVIALVLPECHS